MRIVRLGEVGKERAAVGISDEEAVFVDDVISDWNRVELENDGLAKVMALDLTTRPKVKIADYRIGAPVARPTKVICVGLNYKQHIEETGSDTPVEPVIFMKAPDTVVGGFDDLIIPPHSVKTDYEVEICAVIGKTGLYLSSPEEAAKYILGYTVSQDTSERYWQLERSGQWVKGKSFPTFNPMGPWVVTADSYDPSDVRLWCKVDDDTRQNSRSSDMLYDINYCVWYISQFMELKAGDVINTGTPQGVGMGFKPEKYLQGGEILETGIEGIGIIRSRVTKSK